MKTLVLFVHGLGGGIETWGRFRELLESDPDIGNHVVVHFYTFKTRLFRWFPPFWISPPIQDLAAGLDTEIRHKLSEHQKIVLVSHSLGGLIAKRYLIDGYKNGRERNVKEVIFFATPHLGAEIAVLATKFSLNHRHLTQLGWNSDAIEYINEDWRAQKCEANVSAIYAIGGQDAVVDRLSAAGMSGARPEVLLDKSHRSIAKPESRSDLSFLIVKQACLRWLTDRADDLSALRAAIEATDERAAESLVVNRGRSWIETAEIHSALDLLEAAQRTFEPRSIVSVFAEYLISIGKLFIDKAAPKGSFGDEFLARAEPHGMRLLVLAERMEFARKRGELQPAAHQASAIKTDLRNSPGVIQPLASYSAGVASYLVANLLRAGGRYDLAADAIETSRAAFRPAVLSHQVELAHCQYAASVCRSVLGQAARDDVGQRTVGPELRRFSYALELLASSHSAWGASDLGNAVERVTAAALVFHQIGFKEYARRAEALAILLNTWRGLEITGSVNDMSSGEEELLRVKAMLGDKEALSRVRPWIAKARPSRMLGLLQFASAYNPNWSEDIGTIQLPPILVAEGDALSWASAECNSLASADNWLRTSMLISHSARVPLIAD